MTAHARRRGDAPAAARCADDLSRPAAVAARPAELRGCSRLEPRLAPSRRRQPDHVRDDAVQRLRRGRASPCRTTRAVPRARELPHDDAERAARGAPACRRLRRQRLRGEPRLRRVVACTPTTFGTSTSFGLQFAVCRGAVARRSTRTASCRGSSRCRAASCPSRKTTVRGDAYGIRRRAGTTPACVVQVRQRLLHEALPDQRRERAAGDRRRRGTRSASARACSGSRPRRRPTSCGV